MVGATALQQLSVVLAAALAAVGLYRLDRPRAWGCRLRRRLLLGLPWGTLLTAGLVLATYLLLQGGLDNWYDPVVVPYRAWSFFYPLGMLTASFTHNGPGHLLGNLSGTLVFGSLVEYAWGHYPRERGAHSFGSPTRNPYVRALVLFPAAALGVGVVTAALALGPVIGFSTVVFALAGVALVRYPLASVLGVVLARGLGTARAALLGPTVVARAEPSFSPPWWSQVAIQGHAVGLLLGVLVGYWLLRRGSEDPPGALRVWTGVVLFGMAEALWAVYWFRGNGVFVLYRAVGVALVVLLGVLVTAAVVASDRPLVGDRLAAVPPRRLAVPAAFGGVGLLAATALRGGPVLAYAGVELPLLAAAGAVLLAGAAALALGRSALRNPLAAVPRREAAALVLLLALAALSGPALAVNAVQPSGGDVPGEGVAVRDYRVEYAENVTNELVSVVDISALGESTTVRASGVIVRSPRRGIWTTAVTARRLDFAGNATVRVGGAGWRDAVLASRSGWDVAGNGTAYRVDLHHDGRRVPAFATGPVRADPVVAGRNVSVNATAEGFRLAVTRDGRTVRGPLPTRNESVTLDGVRFVRRNGSVLARFNRTRVRVAARERYPGQR